MTHNIGFLTDHYFINKITDCSLLFFPQTWTQITISQFGTTLA